MRDKLRRQAIEGPASMRFEDLCRLAEQFGFVRRKSGRGSTSHNNIYKRPGYWRILNLQDHNGKAKPYQVEQLLDALRESGEIE